MDKASAANANNTIEVTHAKAVTGFDELHASDIILTGCCKGIYFRLPSLCTHTFCWTHFSLVDINILYFAQAVLCQFKECCQAPWVKPNITKYILLF